MMDLDDTLAGWCTLHLALMHHQGWGADDARLALADHLHHQVEMAIDAATAELSWAAS